MVTKVSKNKVTNLLEGKFGENALVLYLVVFLAVNFAGMSLFSESVWAPYVETGSTDAPDGSVWVDDDSFLWAFDGTEYRIPADSGDDETGGGSSVSGPTGSVWVHGERLYYIDANGDRRWARGEVEDTSPGGSPGNAWIDPSDGKLRYIDEDGDQRYMEDTTP